MGEKIKDTTEALNEAWLDRARILSEALPYMQRYDKRTVVVKYGGHAMGDAGLAAKFARDIVLLKQAGVNPIVVHGGGPQIGSMLKRLNIESEFASGLRITDKSTVEIVEMVLAGSINKQIVGALNQAGGRAVGLCGKDGNLIVARKLEHKIHDPESNIEKLLDLGFVGEPHRVNPEILQTIIASDIIPVIAPIGVSEEGDTYNINADTAAGAIAGAMNAKRLLLLTDVRGVLGKDGKLIQRLSVAEAEALMKDGTISGGMIPKLETCIESVEKGVEAVVIVDGRVPHVVLLELLTEHGAGTLIE
ncbi:acetylglutamate kinase [Tepidicaulis marinus]|uniref:Acetylglutamate kinase n=1 Tax=Tepidicaulis marinus TaxID=1333998 RepID=A0A081BB81_9HYPH|nr:acetylglutamate kinase [Tepidicaulis marinus]GAK45299.1 acetylglutamate kinase [Tepidicaulis marinus]